LSHFFTTEELAALLNAILKWDNVRGQKKQLLLLPREFTVLSRARETIGNLKCGNFEESWRVDSIPLPSSDIKIDRVRNLRKT
jgi:hypothetical protein